MKEARSKKPAELWDAYPFTLPEHVFEPRRDVGDANPIKDWEVVCDINGRIVRRIPSKIELEDAVQPTQDESVAMLFAADGQQISPRRASGENAQIIELAASARRSLARLATLARHGNGKALWHFAGLACEAGEGLSDMMHANPKALRPVARFRARWPLMRSTHPRNSDRDKHLTDLQLGQGVAVMLDKYSKWKPDFAASYAMRLREHIEFIRNENPTICLKDGKRSINELIPAFRRATADTWWKLARQLFLKSYPEPEKIFELDRIADSGKRSFPSRRRQSILEKIRARFLHMAP